MKIKIDTREQMPYHIFVEAVFDGHTAVAHKGITKCNTTSHNIGFR
jgi:hypothetical protein